jgi:predicted neutral ceramidase superfamily lipid hydrolase
MGVEPDAGEIADKIVRMVVSEEEDDYYAVKYGRRMIEALIEVKLKERGAIY